MISYRLSSRLIGLVCRVFVNGLGDLGSISGRVISETLKMVLDTSLPNTQQRKVHIKGKVEQSRGKGSALLYSSVLYLLKREPSGRPRLRSPTTYATIRVSYVGAILLPITVPRVLMQLLL